MNNEVIGVVLPAVVIYFFAIMFFRFTPHRLQLKSPLDMKRLAKKLTFKIYRKLKLPMSILMAVLVLSRKNQYPINDILYTL